jgi:hypothetical protein
MTVPRVDSGRWKVAEAAVLMAPMDGAAAAGDG